MTDIELIQMIKRHEGVRLRPYHCSAGRLTIGVGRNIQDNGISEDEAEMLLLNDVQTCKKLANKYFPWYKKLNSDRQAVIINMMFNLGFARFKYFKKMIAAIELGDYKEASIQMLDSRWANQVGQRAIELSEIMSDLKKS